MRYRMLLLLFCFYHIFPLYSQDYDVIKVWENNQPVEYNINDSTEAMMYIYSPDLDKNTGVAIVICPGGSYSHLAMNHEGHDVAEWLSSEGITAVVLKYRMPLGNFKVPISDLKEATRYLRTNRKEYNINPDKIGVMGFSAGGHLASTHLTTLDDSLSNPNFGILFYPVITSDMNYIHQGSFSNLLGKEASSLDKLKLSNELNISENTPPTILFHSNDDRVSPMNSILFYDGLKRNEINSSALYLFPNGGHGWGFRPQFSYHEIMKSLLLQWINEFRSLD